MTVDDQTEGQCRAPQRAGDCVLPLSEAACSHLVALHGPMVKAACHRILRDAALAEDVVFMVPGKEPFGKESFTASAKDMRNFHVEGTSDIQELRDCGDHHIVRRTEIVRKLLPGAAIVWCDQ